MANKVAAAKRVPSFSRPPVLESQGHNNFSWRRCLMSLITYTLLATDVFRSGASIPHLDLPSFEPNGYFARGPWAYPVVQNLSRHSAIEGGVPVAAYTSAASATSLRAVTFRQNVWPSCVQGDEACPATTFTSSQVFSMLDALVTFVAAQPPHVNFDPSTPMRLALRVRMQHLRTVFDHLVTHFVDVNAFASVWGAYFAGQDAVSGVCDGSIARGRPLFCSKTWARYDRAATGANASVGPIWDHIAARAASLLSAYPTNYTIELVVVESEMDPTPHNGGFVFVALSSFDVVTILRVQTPTNETVVVDEYRYEGTRLWSNPEMWAPWAAFLRYLGQAYVVLRLAMLCVGCYVLTDRNAKTTWRVLCMLPSQVIVYGSWFPVVCYSLAHTVDASLMYHVTARCFVVNEMTSANAGNVLWAVTARMRSLWVLTVAIKILGGSMNIGVWHSSRGVTGVKPHILSAVAFATTLVTGLDLDTAHDSRVLDSFSVEPSTILSLYLSEGFSNVNSLPGGVYGDVMTLLAGVLALSVIHAITMCALYVIDRSAHGIEYFSDTALPFAADVYWSATAMTVGWKDDAPLWRGVGATIVHVAPALHVNQPPMQRQHTRKTSITFFQRCDAWESNFTLMNLVHMTDPLTFLYLRLANVEIYEYSVKHPGGTTNQILHPYDMEDLLQHYVDVAAKDIHLEGVLLTKNVPWKTLVQCC